MKSGLKVKRRRKKRVKSREKKLQKIFCLAASTQGEEMTLIKVAYFMLNFLNLKSKARHLFFWVASSLSMVCSSKKAARFFFQLSCVDYLLEFISIVHRVPQFIGQDKIFLGVC